jgi:cytochrome c biogenesis protein CcdA/thiol-disulfide isomerase/thioredoxin
MDPVLIGVAVVAGVATFLSPCVLPVLPVVLAASANGGRRRPLGIAIGLAVAFVIFTLTASRLLMALGLPQDLLRNLAIAMLAVVGIALLVPAVATQVGRLYHPLAAAAGARLNDGDGFWSGVGLGAVLSLVWTPCAGPILAAVTVLSAESRVSLELVAITAAYALGATVPLFVLALLGNRAAAPLAGVRRGGPMLRRAAGAVLLATAVLFTTDIPTQLAAGAPSYVSSLQHLERSHAAAADLRDLTRSSHNSAAAVAAGQTPDHLKNYGPAPDFTDITRWINTPGSRPLSLAALRGKVVLVDFWTYSCVNCIRTLPYLKQWYARYHRDGLVIVGVHTPEFTFEHVVGNVEQAVGEHGIRYPVAVDDSYGTWNAWGNQYWPADYLIDRNGDVRDAHFGEGGYGQTEDDIRTLLGEPATAPLSRPAGALTPSSAIGTPETYLGTYRAAAYHQQLRAGRDAGYSAPARVAPNQVALAGHWDVQQHQIVAGRDARLLFRYTAPRIYLVAAPPAGGSARLNVRVDGRRLPDVAVPRDDLYQLAHLAGSGSHLLRLDVPPGTTLYSFTFG